MGVQVGHRFQESTFTVDPARVEEFVTALGVEPATGYEPKTGAPVPPGFLMYVTAYGSEPVHEALGVNMLRTLYGGARLEFLKPIRVGDELRVRPVVSDITEKTGSRGTLTFYEVTCEYLLEDGSVALRERSFTIERG